MAKKTWIGGLAAALLAALPGGALACGGPEVWADRALAGDADRRRGAIAALRAFEEAGLEELLERRERLAAREADAAALAELDRVIDAVAQARDARWSGLFWSTDLERARARARRAGKPILSLRLLGKLTHELSCANSRFFRTTLYANEQVAELLRERFVLHWSSERPVPKITVDMGDGRRIERTVTGNSAHYVLLADGTPVDVLPGLYAPGAFRERLEEAAALAERLGRREGAARAEALRSHHARAARRLAARLRAEAGSLRRSVRVLVRGSGEGSPDAVEAAPRAMGKAVVEMPLVVNLLGRRGEGAGATDGRESGGLPTAPASWLWRQLAHDAPEDHWARPSFDARSRRLMRTKCAAAHRTDAAFAELLDRYALRVAQDTLQNEYDLHRRVHRWFAAGEAGSFAELNERVYAELFLTPREDPWLGLVPDGAYAGVADGGLVVPDAEDAVER